MVKRKEIERKRRKKKRRKAWGNEKGKEEGLTKNEGFCLALWELYVRCISKAKNCDLRWKCPIRGNVHGNFTAAKPPELLRTFRYCIATARIKVP
jgi:hypothetical protein